MIIRIKSQTEFKNNLKEKNIYFILADFLAKDFFGKNFELQNKSVIMINKYLDKASELVEKLKKHNLKIIYSEENNNE